MARITFHYKDKNYQLDNYGFWREKQEDGSLKVYLEAVYKGKTYRAEDLPKLRGLLCKVFDDEIQRLGSK